MTSTALAEVCEISMGQAPDGESYNDLGRGLPLIAGAGDFADGKIRVKKYTTAPTRVSKPGDIVLGIRATIGVKVWADDVYCLGRGVAGLRAKPSLDSKYLWHWLSRARRDLERRGRGATFLQVNRSDIGELEIPLPPVEEQRRIAAVLDQAEALRARRLASMALLESLSETIFREMFGNPVTNTRAWPLLPFSEVCPTRLGKMLDQKQQSGRHARPYLRNANVRWFDFDLNDIAEMDFGPAERAEFRVEPGDLLICEGGEPGRAAVWDGRVEEIYFQKALHRGRPDPARATATYLVHLLRHLARRGGLVDHISSATIAHLTGARLKSMKIPVPDLSSQYRFGARVGEVDRLRLLCGQAQSALDVLLSTLQDRAFAGQL